MNEKLFYTSPNGYDVMDAEELLQMENYCTAYKNFLDHSKTERLCVAHSIYLAEKQGFVPYQKGMTLKAGDRVYMNNRGRGLVLAVIGEEPLSQGANISVAHIDSPHLDIKPRPLYEESEMAYFKTYLYGWVRKYQWLALPLAMHGVVMKGDGTLVSVSLGEEEGEPQFIINDLLPHLARQQLKKPLEELFPSKIMNVLVGSHPVNGTEGGQRFKAQVLSLLHEKYGIMEEDLISAELEMVPAGKARDIGFDRSFIASYGHDDRVCAYAELRALFETSIPKKTAVCLLADKEEVNSEGVSGMKSQVFERFMESLCTAQGSDVRDCFSNSFCISADVTSAYDPNFSEVYEKSNTALANHGVALCKYTGSCGDKSDASDASAEVVGKLRRMLNRGKVLWQMSETGLPEAGGGGTVAKFMANRDIDTIDAGVPVLSMHAPFETVSKVDCYMTYKAVCQLYSNEE